MEICRLSTVTSTLSGQFNVYRGSVNRRVRVVSRDRPGALVVLDLSTSSLLVSSKWFTSYSGPTF